VNEDFAGRSVLKEADIEETLVFSDIELVNYRSTGIVDPSSRLKDASG